MKLWRIFRHPVEHAMRYVARRPGLKQAVRPWVARMPFVYRWVVERRTRQIRADFLRAWSKQGSDPRTQASIKGCHLSATPVKTVDEVLQAIRDELGQTQGTPDAK